MPYSSNSTTAKGGAERVSVYKYDAIRERETVRVCTREFSSLEIRYVIV